MALQLKHGDAAYYQSAEYCRNYTSPPVSYGDSSHYLPRLPGPETMLKPPLSLFSHPQQPFQHMDSLHQLGPPPMAPTQPLGPPPISPAQAMGPPTMTPTQTLGPPPITAAHSLRPPPITPAHSLGPPPMAPPQPLGPPPMAHTLGPPPVDHTQAMVPSAMDLTQPLGPPPLNPAHALMPPPVVAPGAGRFTLPPSPLSCPLAPGPDHSQLPPRPPGPVLIPAPVSGPIPGPLPGQAAPASEQSQDEGSPLGMEEQEDSLGLEELCKPLYCKLCNVTLNSAQQAQAHYQGKNHSKKLRNFYAGSQQPPAIRIPEVLEAAGQTAISSGSTDSDTGRQALYKGATRVILATENDYCKLCDASFSSPAVAQAHYQGKNHAKKLRLAEAQQNTNNMEGSSEATPRRNRKDGSEYRLVKNRRSPQLPASMPAYEDKKHSKRKQISSRSWFNSTSATPGGAAGSLLLKLGLQGKEAAVAKALASSHSPLIRKRTGGSGIKTEPCATIARRKSDSEVDTCDKEISEGMVPTQVGQEVTGTNDSDSREVKTTEDKELTGAEDCGKKKEQDRSFGAVTSLVADYSDSDSDPGQ